MQRNLQKEKDIMYLIMIENFIDIVNAKTDKIKNTKL